MTALECKLYEYSLIVPVYNAEAYLEGCIESILKQKGLFELVLVDDGSTDSSGMICDLYAQKYEHIKLFHRENSGPAAARNFGLDNATGKYVVFVDSDDYISEDLTEKLDAGCADKTCDLILYTISNIPKILDLSPDNCETIVSSVVGLLISPR